LQSDAEQPLVDGRSGPAILAIACEAVTRASELVRAREPRRLLLKGDRDVASDVDLTVERFVRKFLHRKMPGVGFLGEEDSDGYEMTDEPLWILDPVDGTVNLIHGVPLCAVSLSLVFGSTTLVAAIDLPFIGAQYTALRGHGSYASGRRIYVSRTDSLKDALVSIDQYSFGEDSQRRNQWRLRLTENLVDRAQRLRVFGASAVDLAWTAQGRLDACVILDNKPWDTSAGVLIAREAGAIVLDQDGSDHSRHSSATIAATPGLMAELMSVVRNTLDEPT
jgi:myo-inositol-1(or 4)-monophosphatase